ncbi:pyridine nucleotide-disulfide oxidoreductase [Azomonas agilis]|uniref:Pyridine nucleotide-disulfide oxidoreductase n=2 Tax=Azomonas agilis TaxID=116849 RepID=A0A562HZF4_9GAMM|nr:pyridine nucleotide-disulfide oxidoreductase [Azomonas agilis]
MTALLDTELRHQGIHLHLGDQLTHCEGDIEHVRCHLASGQILEADQVILSVGVRPDTQVAKAAGLALGQAGHIQVNAYQQTSDPDIYAAGDAVETLDQVFAESSNGSGKDVWLPTMCFRARPYPGSLGTGIVRAFEVAGITGWSEKRLQAQGRIYETVTVNDSHHAGYYPGAKPLTLKILWEPETGRLLGAQVTGFEGIDKRLDILASALAAEMTVEDLCHIRVGLCAAFWSR